MCVGARVETKVRELNTIKWCILNIAFAFLIVGIWDWYHSIGVKKSFLMAYNSIPFNKKTTEIFEKEGRKM